MAATAPEVALLRLRQYLPSGWLVTLTGKSLTSSQAAVLDIRPDEPQKLREAYDQALEMFINDICRVSSQVRSLADASDAPPLPS